MDNKHDDRTRDDVKEDNTMIVLNTAYPVRLRTIRIMSFAPISLHLRFLRLKMSYGRL